MKRIGIMTTGGDTPALNATIHGAVARANQLKVEIYGLMGGYGCLFDAGLPHVRLNPLFSTIPELDPTLGGTILGASRAYIDPRDLSTLDVLADRLKQLQLEGLVIIGGDGSLNGMQPLSERVPAVLAPKTIDNDLGLNYLSEVDEWKRVPFGDAPNYRYERSPSRTKFDLEGMVNYVTPGYATAVYVSATGISRVRTTAEGHRRIAIVEVMGRQSGFIALGATYGQPDLVLVPEYPLQVDLLVERVKEIYDLQQNVVIVCGEGIVDETGNELGALVSSTDPAGNVVLSGAADALAKILMERIGEQFFRDRGVAQTASRAIFTRKVGHTQRGGRPLLFDRHIASEIGGKSVDMLLEGQNNTLATIQWNRDRGFYVDSLDAQKLRDRWGRIHPRSLHPQLYDPEMMMPSRLGVEYLLPIFTNAIGHDDVEYIRQTVFDAGNLFRPYHSVNTDMQKRIRRLPDPTG